MADYFLFKHVVVRWDDFSLQGPLIFLAMLKNDGKFLMDKFDGDVFDSSFWGQTFQDDVCQEVRDSGALALKGQSLELLDPELAKPKVRRYS